MVFYARDCSLTVRAFWTAKMSWDELQGDEKGWSALGWWKQLRRTYLDDMWEEMGWDEKSWDEVRRAHMTWDEMKCRVRSVCVKSAVWSVRKVFAALGVALRRGRAQVMFLDNNTATASHKARTHGPGWRTAHASSERSYSRSLRQLPPRLVQVLLVNIAPMRTVMTWGWFISGFTTLVVLPESSLTWFCFAWSLTGRIFLQWASYYTIAQTVHVEEALKWETDTQSAMEVPA